MLCLSPLIASAQPLTTGAASPDLAVTQAETCDDFAALLGMQVAVASSEATPSTARAHPDLQQSGKGLPDTTDWKAEVARANAPDDAAPDDLGPLTGPALLALATGVDAPVIPAPPPLTLVASTRSAPPPVEPELPQATPQPARAVAAPPGEILTRSNDDMAGKSVAQRPDATARFTFPTQAAARAELVQNAHLVEVDHPTKLAPVLPEQASVQATFALTTRDAPSRPARLAEVVAALALSSDAEPVSALPPTPFRPLREVLSSRGLPVDSQSPLAALVTGDQLQSAPQPATPASSAAVGPIRHDFAAMIDRLFEARDLAGAQPIGMTLRHDDFGAVSLNFRSADDGLTVTMASADPDFARAVNAAGASAGTTSQSDLSRHGGEAASSRQHGAGASSEGPSAQSRGGSREAERDGSRQRRDPTTPPRGQPGRQDGGGIFA